MSAPKETQQEVKTRKTMIIIKIIIMNYLDKEDYIGLTAYLLRFPSTAARTRRGCITVPIVDDSVVEREETFFVSLQSDPRMPRNMIIGRNSTASVTIRDDDAPGMNIRILPVIALIEFKGKARTQGECRGTPPFNS